MFCPKCGTENQEELIYCRSCGEELKIISQAMKKNLPFALISKLDAAIEKKNEKFRRDAILFGLAGPILLISAAFTKLPDAIWSIFFGFLCLFFSVWKFLTYRRSLENPEGDLGELAKRENEKKSAANGLLQLDFSPTGINETEAGQNKPLAGNSSPIGIIYCVKCGVQNSKNILYCRACGANLDLRPLPQGLEKYLPDSFIKGLDVAIAKNNKTESEPLHKFQWNILINSGRWFVLGLIAGAQGIWIIMIALLAVGFCLLIKDSWDFITDRRSLEKESQVIDGDPSARLKTESRETSSFELSPFDLGWKIYSVFLGSILILIGLIYLGIPPAGFWFVLWFSANIVIISKFWGDRQVEIDLKRFEKLQKQTSNETAALPTGKLPASETLPLESPPMNVIEIATKHLKPEVKKVKQSGPMKGAISHKND